MLLKTPNTVDTSAQYALLTVAQDVEGKEYIYLKGVASTVVGSWVTYDELGVTALLTAASVGPVAVAMAITVANTYGWYQIRGSAEACLAANCAADAAIGFETTSGYAGDGRAAGDTIYNAFSRDATTAAAVATVQICYPFVDDNSN